ncbi:MAG: hypothetical protein ABH840_02965, partial [Nanoarchaeota archaeon]
MKKLVLIFSLMFLFGIMALSFMIVSAETITVPSSGGGGGGGSSCVDSDGGINYFQKGYVPMSCAAGATCGVDSDYCKDDKILVEYSCGKQECTTTSNCPNSSVSSDGNGTGQGSCGQVTTCKTVGSSQEYICPDGCSNGACLREASQTCIDSDGGKNYYTKGIAKGIYGSCEDSCITQPNGENWIHECYCDENNPWSASVATACPQGSVCTDGKCQGDVLDMDKCLNDPSNYWDQEANKCFPGYSEHVAQQLCSDPDGGKNILEYAHTYGFRSSYADERDKRIRTGGADGCYNGQLIEYYCDENGYIQTEYINCPNGCDLNSKGTCVRGELITEKITCKFEDTDKEQKCYLAGQFTDADLGTKYCIAAAGPGSCVIAYTGYEGELVTWKSTCGQYQYTTQDGNDEV